MKTAEKNKRWLKRLNKGKNDRLQGVSQAQREGTYMGRKSYLSRYNMSYRRGIRRGFKGLGR